MKGAPKVISVLLVIAGIVVIVAGISTWGVISGNLRDQRITVSSDATCAAGDTVAGPISAYCMAQVIDHHALAATGGKTYAELPQNDPQRTVAMNASFLRASLFTSVVAYGVAAFAVGMGIVLILIAVALLALDKRTATAAPAVSGGTTGSEGATS
ncbi:MAG TPA: aromatic ring-opening dioxygenase LigA [Promineifilum sp.]|nr:aromatic ring-opening dioxygenase LigA [Promineifilum sp.]